MKRTIIAIVAVPVLAALLAALPVPCQAEGLGEWYAGAAGGVALPGSGNSLRRAAEISVRGGRYLCDSVALEIEGTSVPSAATDRAGSTTLTGFGMFALWHMFGYERLDPFLAGGFAARFATHHVFADDSHRTSIGPAAGFGVFYHLTDSWSLRADAWAAMGADSPCGFVYSVSVGLQFSLGGDE